MFVKRAASIALLTIVALLPMRAFSDIGITVTPAFLLPIGPSGDDFALGGELALKVGFDLPLRLPIFAAGSLGYQYYQTEAKSGMSLVNLGAGAGYQLALTPFLKLFGEVTAGGYLGMYTPRSGAMLSGAGLFTGLSATAQVAVTPGVTVNVGAGYRFFTSLKHEIALTVGTLLVPSAFATKPRIRIENLEVQPVFPVLYKHYDSTQLGQLTLVNGEPGTIQNVQVTFLVNQFMELPKTCFEQEQVGKNARIDVPLFALFRDDILSITERTSVSGEIKVRYTYQGKEKTASIPQAVEFHDRNSMTWDDDDKAASFVSARDPMVMSLARNVASLYKTGSATGVQEPLALACALFTALKHLDIIYAIDPSSSYKVLSRKSSVVDYLQFPSQTLTYRAGDCDDLSILYAALLEALGIRTAFITVPGHIYLCFSLGIPEREAARAFSNPDEILMFEGEAWLPVEATSIQEGFFKAWSQGARQWREFSKSNEARLHPLAKAWESFPPVAFNLSESTISLPDESRLQSDIQAQLDGFVDREIQVREAALRKKMPQAQSSVYGNQLAILYARYGRYEKAEAELKALLKREPDYLPALVNLGNIHFLKESYAPAKEMYERAARLRPADKQIGLFLARLEYELKNYVEAARIYQAVASSDPELVKSYSYLGSRAETGERASAQIQKGNVSWIEED